MQGTQSRHHHGIDVFFFGIIGGAKPTLAFNSRSIVFDIHVIGFAFHGRWIACIQATWTVQFFPENNNETIQMLDIGLTIPPDSVLQTRIRLFGQGMSGLIRKKGIFDSRFGMKCIADTN